MARKPLSVETIQTTLAEIKAKAKALDNEAAHSLEDALYQDVLKAVAKGTPDATALATEALKSRRIQFTRQCA